MPTSEAEIQAEREALKFALDPQTEERVVLKLCKEFGLQPAERKSLDQVIALVHTWRLKASAHEAYCEKSATASYPYGTRALRVGDHMMPVTAHMTDDEVIANRTAEAVFGPQIGARGVFEKLIAHGDLEAPSAIDILSVCVDLAMFLMGKNRKYGDSALAPLNILSNASPLEKIKVRMEDKLKRLVYGKVADEDTLMDLVGYWIIMKVAERRAVAAHRETAKENGT